MRSAGHAADVVDDRVAIHASDVTGHELAAAVNRAAHGAGIVLVELSPLRASLEDRYLALLQEEGA